MTKRILPAIFKLAALNKLAKPFCRLAGTAVLLACLAPAPARAAEGAGAALTDAQIDNLVRRSYQYVAMYNVNNKFALKQGGLLIRWSCVRVADGPPYKSAS